MPRKVGDVVRVYEDPLTEKRLEGEAKLLEQLSEDDEREFWLVEFTRGHERHPRWIKKTKHERTSAQEKETARVNYARMLASKACVGLPAGEARDECMREEFEKAYQTLQEPRTFCERLQYFIDEEGNGIAEYQDFVLDFGTQLTSEYRRMVNRVIEEQRNHVEILKRIKREICLG